MKPLFKMKVEKSKKRYVRKLTRNLYESEEENTEVQQDVPKEV